MEYIIIFRFYFYFYHTTFPKTRFMCFVCLKIFFKINCIFSGMGDYYSNKQINMVLLMDF